MKRGRTWVLVLVLVGRCLAQTSPSSHSHPRPHSNPIVVGLPDPTTVRGLLVRHPDRSIDGFARRIVEEAARELGLTVVFKPLDGADGLDALEHGRVDVVSPMSVQEPRLQRAEFTSPLIVVRGAVYSRPGIRLACNLEELSGCRVGVTKDGLSDEWSIEHSLPVTRFESLQALLEAVRDGKVDYALTTQLAARVRIEELGLKGKLREAPLLETSFGRAYAVAVRPDDEILATELSAAFERLRANGRYDALYAKWLEPYQPLDMPPRVPWRVVWASALTVFAALGAAGTGWWLASRRARRRGAELAESEAKYRAIFDRSEDAILLFRPADEVVIDANDRALTIYGYPRERFVGLSLESISTNIARGRRFIREMLETASPVSFVSRQRRADGALIDLDISASLVEVDGESCILSINRDVTESRRAAEARDRERRLFLAGPVVVFRWGHDASWPVEYVSENVLQFGYSHHEIAEGSCRFASLIHPEDLPRVEAEVQAAVESGSQSIDQSFRIRSACGRWRWLQLHLVLARDATGSVTHREGYALDDTVRREAVELLRASEQRYRDFVNQTTEGVWRVEFREPVPIDLPAGAQLDAWFRDGYLAECNDAFARMYGLESAERLVGAPLRQLLPPDDPRNRALLNSFIADGYRLRNAESFEVAASGGSRVFLNSLVGIIEGGRLVRAWGTQLDVTELRATTQALQQSRARLADILRALPDIVLGLDREGRVLDVHGSDQAALYADPGAFVGRSLAAVLPEPVASELLGAAGRAAWSGVAESVEYEMDLAGGSKRFEARVVASAGRGATVVIRDITAREEARRRAEQLERDLQHTRRVESLGVMAGGIAHDFNNLLAGIVGNAELALAQTVNESPRRLLQSVITACRHASDLTRQLLAYAGKSVIRPTNLDLATTAGELLDTVRPRLGERLTARLDAAPVRGDATLIRQTILNILVNAADAVADRPEGRVGVEVGVREFDSTDLRTAAGTPPPPGRYAYVRVRDAGAGIAPEALPHLFEPFFSTKSSGRGLGLSVAQRTALDHGGALLVESDPGLGATFTLLLPPTATPSPHADASAAPKEPIDGHGRRALVVDDQPLVLGVARRMLERSGWSTLGAGSAAEALDAIATQGPFDLVLVDLTMPDGPGTEVVARGRAIHPSQRFVMMSGYQPAEARADCPFLLKPFTMDELRAAILACDPPTPSPQPATASPP